MHLHILGICGTFMGSLALLARELGHQVTGSDQNVYPPMSTQLEAAGIELIPGYDPSQLEPAPDMVVIGNAMSRGNACVEAVLNSAIPYCSGPQWLHDNLLQSRWVLAVAGTHGKTTTASMLAWILEYAGMQPGYLIGGVPLNFEVSARLGQTDFFVIEADEYDTAFFDKRSKFVHYAPRTLVLNNLEFDHADIFSDLSAIERQFHHLMRIVPSQGQVIYPHQSEALCRVLEMGCWSNKLATSISRSDNTQAWIEPSPESAQCFSICLENAERASVSWGLTGEHNQVNALHAALAARHVGVQLSTAAEALCQFRSVKRRMELRADFAGIRVYDDFAHHPTAIATTLEGVRLAQPETNIIAIIEPRSNTMKQGVFGTQLAQSASTADSVFWYQPAGQDWSLTDAIGNADRQYVFSDIDSMLDAILARLPLNTQCAEKRFIDSHIVVMSNGGFEGVHERLINALLEYHQTEERH